MNVINKLCLVFAMFLFSGCVSAVDKAASTDVARANSAEVTKVDSAATHQVNAVLARERLPVSYALQGTSTAVVGIAIDKNGVPLETVREIILKPGQRAIFAGPDEFQIIFKDKKFPDKNVQYRSANGVITINVPKDILERPEFREEYAKYNQVRFNYAIRIKGRELDPPFIIKRDD